MTNLNQEKVDRLVDLWEEGYGYTKIAGELGLSVDDVRNELNKLDKLRRGDESLSERVEGIRKFNKSKRGKVENQILYGVMWVQDVKISELADKLLTSRRTVQRWIYDGVIPREEYQREVEDILGISRYVLFNERCFK